MSLSADETTIPPAPALPDASRGEERPPTTGVDTPPVLPKTPTTAGGATGVDTPPVLPETPAVATGTPDAESDPPTSMSLDGELPRLGTTPTPVTPSPSTPPTSSTSPTHEAAAPLGETPLELPTLPTLPTAAPVITGPQGIPAPDAQPSAGDVASDDTGDAAPSPANDHPMAHLMPQKTAPSEASQRAADIRAAKKAKAKKIKIGVAVGSLVFLGVVGPPLGRWLADAVNEAGNTSTEEPAP